MARSLSPALKRALYARTDGDLLRDTLSVLPVGWTEYASGPKPAWWQGADGSGGPIGPNGPWLTSILPAVTRCTGIIADTLTRTPWRYFTTDGKFLTRPTWIDDPMLVGRVPGPNSGLAPAGRRIDGHSFFSTWITHSIWWGLGAFVCAEAADGTPLAGSLRLINPYMLGVDDDGHWVIDPHGPTPVRTNFEGRFIMGGRIWRLVTLRGLGPNDGVTPEGVLTRHWATFKLGAAVSQYVASTFTSGVPSGFLKVSTANFGEDDAERLKTRWMAAHGTGRRSIAVLNSTVDFQPISISPVDADAAAVVHVTRGDIAHAFGLSAVFLDEGASGMVYNNNSDRRRDLVDISLSGYSERLMATLTTCMPYGQRVEINWTAFSAPSIDIHLNALAVGVQTGIITANEARQYLGLARPTGSDPAWTDISPGANPDRVPELSTEAGAVP